MLLSASTAAWCSLLWALAALHTLRWSPALAQQCKTASRQESGSCSKDTASLEHILHSMKIFLSFKADHRLGMRAS